MNQSARLLLSASLTLAVVLAACGGGAAATPVPLTVIATELAFDPSRLTAKAGTATKVILKNAGTVEHDITIDKINFKLHVLAGQSGESTLTAPAGTYEFRSV